MSATPTNLPRRFGVALDVEGPAVVSVECNADEIPPFAPFLTALSGNAAVTEQITTAKENRADVAASA